MPTNSLGLLFTFVLLCGLTEPLIAETPLPAKIQFNRDVRQILSDKCFFCHGPDANHRQADLRFDIRENVLKSGAFDTTTPNEDGLPDDLDVKTRILPPRI